MAIYDQVNTTDSQGTSVMILVPNATATNPYNAGNPTGTIIYAHGVGEDQTALVSDSLKSGCVATLINAGYLMAGTNDAGWGTQSSIDCYLRLNILMRANYNVSNVCVWSQSMGGLAGLMTLTQLSTVIGWLGTYPICSLSAAYNGTGGTDFSSNINTAFGITGTGGNTYALLTSGFDPLLRNAFDYGTVPMRFYASPSDTVVGKTQNSDAFHSWISSTRRESTVVACTGNHGDPSHFQPSDYAAFFARCFTNPANSRSSSSGFR